MRTIFRILILFLIFLPIAYQISMKSWTETDQEYFEIEPYNIKQAGFWNNFTFIHITNLNWTIANETDWCSGSGTWSDPYLIENMIINASDSPIGYGILIENSTNIYFKIENVTIFGATDGIKLENTNNGNLINNTLSENLYSGIYLNNCENNTILRNILVNNGIWGVNLTSYSKNNRIIENTAKNEGTNFQDIGIYLGSDSYNNDIIGNLVYDNSIYGIYIEDNCRENLIYNNTIKNLATNQQDYGISVTSNCEQNNISLNLFEDLNSYVLILVGSYENLINDNLIRDCGSGLYLVNADQNKITGNTISGGSSAIYMSGCDGGEIIRNFINTTGAYAIKLHLNCYNNEFHDNIIRDNNLGIQLDDPSDINNKFYKNSFISNGIHAYDNGTATYWNNSVVGNYWDNYSGIDLNNDHIGDTPYNISGAANANDSLPIYDHGSPFITINAPTSINYGTETPEFNIFINDPFIYSMWYTINNSAIRYYFTENGTINEEIWAALTDGNLTISFYARDIAWNIGSNSVDIIKNTSGNPGDGLNDDPSTIDLIPIIIIISLIAISAVILVGILIRKKSNNEKTQKSRFLNEDQLAQAQYIEDVKNILTIIAIHKESGLALSKIALHGGIGLDENLFTGFISAMGSFKNELAKQMGLRVREEGGDNVIEYNEFTITIMDGEYLRLGLVSHSSLGTSIKQQCGQTLRNYELKHVNNLKNFDGEIQVFKDFEEIVKSEVIDNLNPKS